MRSSADASPARKTPTLEGRPRIGVLGHFGDANLGDEAIIEAFVTRLRREWPDLELRIFSMHPSDSRRRYGCAAYSLRRATEYEQTFRPLQEFLAATRPPQASAAEIDNHAAGIASSASLSDRLTRRLGMIVPPGRLRSTMAALARGAVSGLAELGFLWRSLKRIRGLDVLYVTGSNQFLDNFGGPWGFPYTLLKWTVMSRLVGCRVAFVSVGAGPLDRRLSHWMISRAIGLADYLSLRDEGSQSLIQRATGHEGRVLPDLAHSLDTGMPPTRSDPRGRVHVAINAMPVHDPRYWHQPDPEKYRRYVNALARVCNQLLAAGHDVSFFATQFPDANVARDIAKDLRGSEGELVINVPSTVSELLAFLNQADVIVATRFHGILLSLLMNRPTVGICYYRKSRELLTRAGLANCAFDIDDFDSAELASAVLRMIGTRDEVSSAIGTHNQAYREALEDQYQVLFDLVRRRRVSR